MGILPADNVGVDTERRWLQGVRTYLKSLEPASSLSAAQVTALKALLTVTAEAEADPPSQGSIPYQGLSEATTLPLGTPGQFLGVNDQATAPEWQDAPGGTETLLVEPALSGSAYLIDSTVITKSFKSFTILIIGASPSSGGSSRFLNLELSSDNGLTWSTSTTITATSGTSAADVHSLEVVVFNADAISGNRDVRSFSKGPSTTFTPTFYTEAAITGPINAIRIGWNISSFDAGSLTLVGQN